MKKIFLLAPLLIAIGVAVFLLSSSNKTPYPMSASEVPVVVPSGSDAAEIQSCLDSAEGYEITECVKGLLTRNVTLGKYGLALGQLRYAADRENIISAACHGYAHDMGLQVFEQGMPILEVYKLGWNDCKMGFPHGAQLAATVNLSKENVESEFTRLCAPLSDFGDRAVGECAHLMGHTIADLWLDDISSGVAACQVTGDRNYSFCINGLIMRYAEIIDLAQVTEDPEAARVMRTVWGDSFTTQIKTMTEVCKNGLNASASSVCANSIPSLGAALWKDPENNLIDWSKVHKICEAFPSSSPEEEYCQKGIGAAAITYITMPRELVLEACDQGKGYANCVHTVANAIASHSPTGDPDDLICSLVKESAYAKCLEGFKQGVSISNSLEGP